jgi:endonuclease YncB( thermonuclease family)
MRLTIALSVSMLLAAPAAAQEACNIVPLGSATVAAVRDGRTLLLDGGGELRLAGIETAERSPAALQALIGDGTLRLAGLSAARDRYGRLNAFAYAPGATRSVQETLLMQGEARVSAHVGNKACAEALLTAEKEAREAGRGLWADPNFAPLSPKDYDRLRAERGHFTIVEGEVLSVRQSGGTLYLNFGRQWTRDFSVVIPRRHQRIFKAAGLDLKQLESRRIRVRGIIEQRRGPVIEADAPEQIELAEDVASAHEARP